MSFTEVTKSDKPVVCECCGETVQTLWRWKPSTILAPGYKELYCVKCSKRPNTDVCTCKVAKPPTFPPL